MIQTHGFQTSIILAIILAMVQNDDHEDYGYLQFAADAVKQAYAARQNNTVNSTNHIPAIAMGPQIPAKGYRVQEIRDHLYWVTNKL